MPQRATPATLSSDLLTCTFADGAHVVFDYPVPTLGAHSTDPGGIKLTIYAPDGSECGRIAKFENANTIVQLGAGATVAAWETPLDGADYRLTCPSHTYTTNADDPLACSSVPNFAYSLGGAPYEFTIVSAATPPPLFTCQ
jgi:hypothetical protein